MTICTAPVICLDVLSGKPMLVVFTMPIVPTDNQKLKNCLGKSKITH